MGTTCLLLWGGQCRYGDKAEQRVLAWLAAFLEKSSFPATGATHTHSIQPLHVLAYEAALLAGHKIDDESDDAVLARKKLLSLVSDEKDGGEKKRKRSRGLTKLRKNLKIEFGKASAVDMKPFVQAILGTKLADKTYMRLGIDPSFIENDEPSPLFLYDGYKIKKAYGTSYQRVSVDWMEWKDVPTTLDRWAYFKMVRMLDLGINEKPHLIISMFVPPSKSAFGGEEFDY